MNQKYVHDLADELAIYAYELRVSQTDVPYVMQPGVRAAGTKKLSLYVDDLTIDGDLVNLGQDITIVARAVHLTEQTVIDVGGADPAHTFAHGALPVQTATGFGSPGAPGGDASPALPSGNVTLAVGALDRAHQPSGPTGSVSPLAKWLDGVVSTAAVRAAVSTAVAALPVVFPVSMTFAGMHLVVDATGATASGADDFCLTRATLLPGRGDLEVDLTFAALRLAGTVTAGSNDQPVSTISFGATVRLCLATDGSATGHRVALTGSPKIVIGGATDSMPVTTDDASLPAGVLAAVAARLGPVLASAVAAARPSLGLVVSAQGGPGGRGQDGHGGIVGSPGANGVAAAGDLGWIDHGVVVGWPTGAEGKPGSPGGAAGSAGSSTAGAAGGHVTITSGSAIGVPIVTSSTGGGGGDAAEPGPVGPGGAGGPGATISAQVAGEPNGVVEQCQAPSGSDGPSGAPPKAAGAQGADGTDGSLVFDGAPLTVPASTAGGSDGALATSVPLALLLVIDQGNAVDHLDARTADDLVAVVARYHWLTAVTAPFAAGEDPSHGRFTATDIAVRRALHTSARLELARIAQGLDYYGNVLNWVPVLSMAALQARVATLLDLGKLVEDTYLGYRQQGATTETRLSDLDAQHQHVRAKIASEKAAIAALDSAVDDAEAQVTASLQPLIDQQQRLVDDEFEFKEQFVAYVTGQAACSFLGVLQAMVGIVVSAAEVAVGVGEIAVLTEAATMTEMAASIVKVVKAVEAEVEDIKKAVESVQSLTATDVDAAKFVVDEQKFDAFIDQYLGKFPAAEALAAAVHQYFALIKVHNKLTLAYVGLYLRRARLQVAVGRDEAVVEGIAAARAALAAGAPLAEEATLVTTSYWDLKADLLRELYEFNRAYTYWSLVDRPFVTSDATIADLAATYVAWTNDIDAFLEQTGPVQPFEEQIAITAADFPEAFASLGRTRTLNVALPLRTIAPTSFAAMTHIVAIRVAVALPDIHPTSGAVLIELTHSGLSERNSGLDLSVPANVQTFNHARRTIPYKIDYGNPNNSAGGLIGDSEQGFPGLSPFTMWQISFKAPGNEWLDVTQITRVQLTFSGTFLLGLSR